MSNYPDVLGYITDAGRYNVGVVQTALAVRPRVVKSGHPFEVILLMQNAADVKADVTVTVRLPDAKGKKDYFIIDKEKLVVQLQPAEVGYVVMPVTTLPDTPAGSDYTISVELNVKPLGKPTRVREIEGEASPPLDVEKLPATRRKAVEALQKLKFSIQQKKGGLLRSVTGLEVTFGVLAGKTGTPLNLKPGWVSVWTLGEQDDVAELMRRYREVMAIRLLPKIDKAELQPLLLEKTQQRFQEAGYPLTGIEVSAITKLMLLILEYADVTRTAQNIVDAGDYFIKKRLEKDDEEGAAPLPNWAETMLRAIARDERVASVPNKAIPHFAYNALLQDAIIYGFKEVGRTTGEEMGTPDEIQSYAETLLEKLSSKGKLHFSYVYVPLVLAGVTVYDRVLLPEEKIADLLEDLRTMLEKREHEFSEEDEEDMLMYGLAKRVVEMALRKYGSYR
ncbi:MAG: hypothetical protein OHK0046_11650 [Anaerolineae bacterium]